MRSAMRLRRLAAGLGAGLLLLTILAGVPAVLVAAGSGLAPHHVPTPGRIADLLLHRDDTGRLFLQALLALGWVAWGSFALSTVAELAGRARRRRTIRLPGLRLPQRYVAALLTTIALSFAAPVAAAAAPLATHAPVHAPRIVATASVIRAPHATASPATRSSAAGTFAAGAFPGSAASGSAASGTAVSQQAAAGEVAVTAHGGPAVYEVRHGDYLGVIAERFEGHFDAYHQLAAANHIDDPSLIHPGERIVLPAGVHDRGPTPHATGHLTGHPVAPTHDPGVSGGASGGHGGSLEQPQDPPASQAGDPGGGGGTHAVTAAHPPAQAQGGASGAGADPPGDQHVAQAGDLSGVLVDGVGTLAAAIGAVAVFRRRQSLQRRLVARQPAQRPAGASPDGSGLDVYGPAGYGRDGYGRDGYGAAAGTGPDAGRDVPGVRLMPAPRQRDLVRLDAALRFLGDRLSAWPIERLPQITGAYLDRGAITLMLAGAAGAPPEPYVLDGNGWWHLGAEAPLPPAAAEAIAPLPSLAMVGGRNGQHLLLDLEFLRAVSVTGDPVAVRDLLRYVVLDLSHNIWADDLRITLAGFDPAEADLLRSADPRRIRRIDTVSEAIDAYGRRLDAAASRTGGSGDDEPNDVLVIAGPDPRDASLIAALEAALHATAGTGISLLVAPATHPCRYHMTVDADGVLDIDWLSAALPAATVPEAMLGDVAGYLTRQRAAGAVTPIDVARARSRAARASTSRRPVPVAGQHRRDKGDPVPSWATIGEELMRARHARTA